MPDLPGHERRHERRLERTLDEDLVGAPPGFLLDYEDRRSHEHVDEVPRERWDPAGPANFLARGDGEKDD